MPQNVGSREDLISKNIQSRHIEFCKAERTTGKLTLQDIDTTVRQKMNEKLARPRENRVGEWPSASTRDKFSPYERGFRAGLTRTTIKHRKTNYNPLHRSGLHV